MIRVYARDIMENEKIDKVNALAERMYESNDEYDFYYFLILSESTLDFDTLYEDGCFYINDDIDMDIPKNTVEKNITFKYLER